MPDNRRPELSPDRASEAVDPPTGRRAVQVDHAERLSVQANKRQGVAVRARDGRLWSAREPRRRV
jgi:hypothetical protein